MGKIAELKYIILDDKMEHKLIAWYRCFIYVFFSCLRKITYYNTWYHYM